MGEWKTIDSAPKDGTSIICFAPGNRRAQFFVDQVPVIRIDHHWDEARTFAKMRPENPYTHWTELPPPPKD